MHIYQGWLAEKNSITMPRIIKILLFFVLIVMPFIGLGQKFYQTISGEVEFFSSAPLEDIVAVSNEGTAVWNIENGDISFKVAIRSFRFEKALMQEHFNENYMESEKYSEASFKGNVRGEIDLKSTQEQNVNIQGELTVHGVSRHRDISGTIKFTSDGKGLVLHANFKVKCIDHSIKIPKLLWNKIGEVIDVSLKSQFKLITK